MKPKVTIGMCVHNGGATLREAVESIISQNFPHELIEIIFVDDGSFDETRYVLNEYIKKIDMKARIISQPWHGLGYSRNIVVKNADGDYILWVDSDMILPKDHIKRQVEFMDSTPNVGIAKARYGMFTGENSVAALQNIPFMLYDSKNGSLNLKLPGTGGAIFRVEAVRHVGGFDNRMGGVGEDQDVAFRIRAAGWAISRSPAFFWERRVRTWKGLWRKWYWYGQGDYQLFCKNRRIISLYRMNPVAGFLNGILQMMDAYRLTHRMFVFLMPFHYAFAMAAWCAGFLKARSVATSLD